MGSLTRFDLRARTAPERRQANNADYIEGTLAKAAFRALRLAFVVGVCWEEATDNYEVVTSILPRVTWVYLKGRHVVEVKPLVEDGCTSPGE